MYEIDFLKGFVLHLLDATINLAPEGLWCILGIQYIIGSVSHLSSILSLNFSHISI